MTPTYVVIGWVEAATSGLVSFDENDTEVPGVWWQHDCVVLAAPHFRISPETGFEPVEDAWGTVRYIRTVW